MPNFDHDPGKRDKFIGRFAAESIVLTADWTAPAIRSWFSKGEGKIASLYATRDHSPDRNCEGYVAINVNQGVVAVAAVHAVVGVEVRIGLPLFGGLLVLGCCLVLVVFLLLGKPAEGGLPSSSLFSSSQLIGPGGVLVTTDRKALTSSGRCRKVQRDGGGGVP